MIMLLLQVVLIAPPAPCAVAGGPPQVVAYRSQAIIRHEWVCTWATRNPTAPWTYPEMPGVIAIGIGPVAPLQMPGASGCWLMAQPDAYIFPAPATLLTMSNGIARVRFAFPHDTMGTTFYLQLLTLDSQTPAGLIASQLLAVTPEPGH